MGNEIDKTASLLSCDCRRFMGGERERERERLTDKETIAKRNGSRNSESRFGDFSGFFFLGLVLFFYKRRNCEHEKIREREREKERYEEEK